MTEEPTPISVDPAVLALAEKAVAAGHASSVSAFFEEAGRQHAARQQRAADLQRRWGPFDSDLLARASALLDDPGVGDDSMRAAS